MTFTKTQIPGLVLVDLVRFEDERGFFARAWSSQEFAEQGLASEFTQVNISSNARKGTIRGLHYQKAPHEDAKFVRCIRGALFDVAIDLRPESPTYLQWAGFELSADSRRAIHVPAGCAHGIQALEDDTEMLYMVSASYNAAAEGGIRWDDPLFNVQWPDVGPKTISAKDRSWPDYQALTS